MIDFTWGEIMIDRDNEVSRVDYWYNSSDSVGQWKIR